MKELRGKKMAVPNGVSENGVLAADLAAEAGKQAMQYQVCGHVPSRTPGLALPVTWPRGKAQGGRTPEWGEGWEGPDLRAFQRVREQCGCLLGRPPGAALPAPPSVRWPRPPRS